MSPIKARVMLVGAYGKMGTMAASYISADARFSLSSQIGRHDHLLDSIEADKPDIILDLSSADAVFSNSQIYVQFPHAFVIGSSGLKLDEIEYLTEMCQKKQQAALIVPNFSIGAILQMRFAKLAAKWFDAVDILEAHHPQKLDSPSATAWRTAQMIDQEKPHWPKAVSTPAAGRETFYQEIPLHAIRMPGILAMQDVLFGQDGETLKISHQIIDRKAYMPGLLLALEKVQGLDHLVYGLDHWLF